MPHDPVGQYFRQKKVSRAIQLLAARWFGLQAHFAKRVFCGEDGSITPQGERLLALLAREAKLHRHGFNGDADRRLWDAGAQHIVRCLIDWTEADSSRLARLEQQLQDEVKAKG